MSQARGSLVLNLDSDKNLRFGLVSEITPAGVQKLSRAVFVPAACAAKLLIKEVQ